VRSATGSVEWGATVAISIVLFASAPLFVATKVTL
jgi:hypothetical protein